MIETLWWIWYPVGALASYRWIVGAFLDDAMSEYQREPDGGDIGFSLIFAAFVAFVWPIFWTYRAAKILLIRNAGVSSPDWFRIFPAPPYSDKQKKRELNARR